MSWRFEPTLQRNIRIHAQSSIYFSHLINAAVPALVALFMLCRQREALGKMRSLLTFVRCNATLLQRDTTRCVVAPPSLGVSSLDSGRLFGVRPFFLGSASMPLSEVRYSAAMDQAEKALSGIAVSSCTKSMRSAATRVKSAPRSWVSSSM